MNRDRHALLNLLTILTAGLVALLIIFWAGGWAR